MRCHILSRNSSLFATKRLAEEGRKLGMKIMIVDTLRLSVVVAPEKNSLLYKGKPIKIPDVAIPRIGASITSFGGCVMVQFEQMDVPLLNSSMGMYNSRDKLRCTQILSGHNLPTPITMMMRRPNKRDLGNIDGMGRKVLIKARVQSAIEALRGPPAIIKLPRGTQGVGVILCNSLNEIYAQVDMLWKQGQEFLIQEFIAESKGVDYRAMVINGEVVASMKRESKTGDFRSNTHQGGEVSDYKLPKEAKEIAIKATEAVGLKVAGVDMLKSKDGFKIIEVNSTPGFQGLEVATGKNIAGEIMQYAKSLRTRKFKKTEKEVEVLTQSSIITEDNIPPWEDQPLLNQETPHA